MFQTGSILSPIHWDPDLYRKPSKREKSPATPFSKTGLAEVGRVLYNGFGNFVVRPDRRTSVHLFPILKRPMRKFVRKFFVFLSPFVIALSVELFILPIDFFTFRVWEAVLVKHVRHLLPGPFYPNTDLRRIEEGDLAHHTKFAVKKEVEWKTDRWGYRKGNTDRKRHEIVIIGESNIAGSSLTQKDMLSEILEERLGVSVYPLAPVTVSTFFKDQRFTDYPPTIVIFASVERLIPFIEMPKFPRGKRSNGFLSKLGNRARESRWIQSMAVLLDRLCKGNMRNYFRASLRRRVTGAEVFLPQGNPLFFFEGKPVVQKITEAQFGKIVQTLTGYDNLLKQRGIRFIFLPIPNKENFSPGQLEMKEKPLFLNKLIGEMKKKGIETIDSQKGFEEAYRRDSALLFHVDDSHWNPKGVHLIADLTIRLIKKNE
jgi:hypothetical protein